MNRQFTLPAVIACSVHATLLFAFPSSPSAARKVKAPEPEYKQYELKPAEEKPEDPVPDASASAPGGRPQIAPPSSPEPLPTKVPLDGIIMERNAEITPRVDVKTDTIPNGPFSPHGVIDGNPFGGDGNGPAVFIASSLDREPRTRTQAEPIYPHAMKAAGIAGEVVVQFTVDESGAVLNPRVIRSSHRDFEEPTLRAVSRWRFEPGTKNMKPVRFSMTVPVVFNVGD